MLDAIGDAVIALDIDKKIIYWNDAATITYGWKQNEVLGSNFVELTEPKVSENETHVITKLLEKGEGWSGEYNVRHRDGHWFPVFAYSSPVFDDNKNLIAVINTSHDITKRKLAEVALKESEARYRHLVMNAPAAIYEISADGSRFHSVNETMCCILGYTQEELLDMKPSDILDDESKDRFRERIRMRLSGEDIDESVAYRIHGRDGRGIWATLNIRLNNEWGGTVLVVAHDITERKVAEDKLQTAYKLTSSILDSINGSFIALDKNWRFTYINQQAAVPETSPENLIGKSIWDAFPEIIGTPLETLYREVMTSRKPQVYENKSNVAQGKYFELHVYPVGDDALAIFGLDITDRKDAEVALREAQERTNTILEGIADTFYSLDSKWRFVTVNPAAEKAPFGRPASELLGRVIWDLYPGLLGSRIHQHYLDAAEKHTLEHYVAQSPLNGRYYEVFMKGRLTGVDVYMRDVTDNKQAEDILRESEKRLSLAQKAAGAGTWDWNITKGEIVWSQELYDLFGVDPKKTSASFDLWNSVLHPDDKEDANARIEKALVTHTGLDSEYRIIGPDHQVRWINALGEGVYDDNGQAVHMYGICIDITKRHEAEEALRQREEQLLRAHDLLESVTKGTDVIIAVQDTNFRYIYFNQTYKEEIKRLTGKDLSIGTSMIELFADIPEEQRMSINEWSRVLNGENVNQMIEFGNSGEHRRVYHVLHTPIRDAQGNIIGAGEVSYNVTRQIQIEDALRETKEYLDNLITYANAPIIVWDPQFRITLFNHAFEHLTGRKAKDVIGKPLEFLLPENYLAPAMALIRKTTGGERWESVEIPILHKKGGIRTVLWNSASIFGSDGKTIVSTIAQGLDITDRKKIESMYRERAAEYAALNITLEEEVRQRKISDKTLKETLSLLNASLESTADGILVVDLQGKITSFNKNFMDMWNIPQEVLESGDNQTVINHVLPQLKNPEGYVTSLRELEVYPGRESFDMIEFKDGKIFERYSKPQKIGESVVGRVWSFRDITDRKHAEENLLASIHEKEVLLREIHHRVKNNLQLISGLLDMTRMRTVDESTNTILTDLMLKIQTMAQIHTRLYESKQFGKISLTGQIRDQVTALSNIYSHKGHEIICEMDAQEIFLPVDQAIPCALVVNEILSNAYKHAFKGRKLGTIEISALQENGQIRIMVRDDGIGIPDNFDISRTNSLGLKLIRTLVQSQLKGSLMFKSQNGTEVTLEFPVIIGGT
jgi:PAS domain S-box-containing protein